MPWTVDARVPVRLGALRDAADGDALLLESDLEAGGRTAARFDTASPDHAAGCACCMPRSSAALALNGLFQARAKGEIPFFRRILAVTATPEGDLEIWSALRADPLVAGRFRLESE